MVAAIIAPILAAVMPLGPTPAVLRRGMHAGWRRVAGTPPSRMARTRRRSVPANARVPPEGFPTRVLGVPGAAPVPAAPVVGGDEAHHGNAERGDADVGQISRLPVIIEADVLAVDPAPVVRPADVAPGLVLQAALDVERLALGD